MNQRNSPLRRSRHTRHAFTLVEVLVALGILAILLVIIVLPLRLGFDSFNKGNAQALTQSALQATMTDMEKDLRQAVYVFPNARVAGITNKPPYTDQLTPNNGPYDARQPYYLSKDVDKITDPTDIVCGGSASVENWSNPSRLDMIQVRRDDKGNVLTPLAPSYNIVTYYARRQDLTKSYDPVDNPIVMYRAEYPAFGLIGTAPNQSPAPLRVQSPTGPFNAQIDFKRINTAASPAATECTGPAGTDTNRSGQWLSHNFYGEADLLPLTKLGNDTDPDAAQYDPASGFATDGSSYSQTLAIPRGLALEATNGYRSLGPAADAKGALVPDTSFTTTDTNDDEKIDRVTISLGLASFEVGAQGQFDATTQQPKGTVLRGTRTIELPNIK